MAKRKTLAEKKLDLLSKCTAYYSKWRGVLGLFGERYTNFGHI